LSSFACSVISPSCADVFYFISNKSILVGVPLPKHFYLTTQFWGVFGQKSCGLIMEPNFLVVNLVLSGVLLYFIECMVTLSNSTNTSFKLERLEKCLCCSDWHVL